MREREHAEGKEEGGVGGGLVQWEGCQKKEEEEEQEREGGGEKMGKT